MFVAFGEQLLRETRIACDRECGIEVAGGEEPYWFIFGDCLNNSYTLQHLGLLKSYRKDRVFENLVKKYLVDNDDFIVLRGRNNMQLIEE